MTLATAVTAAPAPPRRWWAWLALVCGAALAVRVGYVLALFNPIHVAGDAYQYHNGANLLVDGKGFIDAWTYAVTGASRQTVLHPPLYVIALAIPSALGLRSALDHQIWSCLLGTATVALVGLAGRQLAGRRAGLIAAAIAAVYPNLWIFDGMLAAETLSLLTTALALLVAYRLWRRPSIRAAIGLGVACALAALTRGEGLAYLPLVALPVVLVIRRVSLGRRLALGGIAALAAGASLAPWIGFNLGRFERPVLTGRFDVAFVAANCNAAYFGPGTGYWSLACFPKAAPPPGDESTDAGYYTRVGLDYVLGHLGRLPVVVLTRIGRAFDLYHPMGQLRLEAYAEGRDLAVAEAGLASYYVLVAASVAGAVLLVRRRVPLLPLLGLVATAVVTVATSYGITRYRVSAELVPVLLGAVALDRVAASAPRWGAWPRPGRRPLVAEQPGSEGDADGRHPPLVDASRPGTA